MTNKAPLEIRQAVSDEKIKNLEKQLERLNNAQQKNTRAIREGRAAGKVLLWIFGACGIVAGFLKAIGVL